MEFRADHLATGLIRQQVDRADGDGRFRRRERIVERLPAGAVQVQVEEVRFGESADGDVRADLRWTDVVKVGADGLPVLGSEEDVPSVPDAEDASPGGVPLEVDDVDRTQPVERADVGCGKQVGGRRFEDLEVRKDVSDFQHGAGMRARGHAARRDRARHGDAGAGQSLDFLPERRIGEKGNEDGLAVGMKFDDEDSRVDLVRECAADESRQPDQPVDVLARKEFASRDAQGRRRRSVRDQPRPVGMGRSAFGKDGGGDAAQIEAVTGLDAEIAVGAGNVESDGACVILDADAMRGVAIRHAFQRDGLNSEGRAVGFVAVDDGVQLRGRAKLLSRQSRTESEDGQENHHFAEGRGHIKT